MNNYKPYRNVTNIPYKRGFLSYLIAGTIGAIIGGILVLTFAPPVLFDGAISNYSTSKSSLKQGEQVIIPQKNDISLTTAIAKKAMPSVVGIRTTRYIDNMFLGGTKAEGVGSGVIVDKRGYIITNNHVANDKDSEITVFLIDGRSLSGKVEWTDEDIDLSVIKIDADNLEAADIGDSENIEVGELAVAIGNPFGLRFQRSVTAGIISALNRSVPITEEKYMEDLIQTDAFINEDNSGGPLLNSEGKVIGINIYKAGFAEGMGFAIPINIAIPIIKSFINKGEFITPYIGLTGLDKEIADIYGCKIDRGIYVLNIDLNGPAYRAGIRKNDIIIQINNIPMNTLTALKQAIYSAGAGNHVDIKYQDGYGKIKSTVVKLESMNKQQVKER